jgi:hypothetical protein
MNGSTIIESSSVVSRQEVEPRLKLKLWKRAVVAMWLGWEKLFHWVYHLRSASPKDPMLHFRSRVYHGARVEMEHGYVMQNGDPIIELHFDNQKLFELGVTSRSTMHLAIRMIRMMEQQLPDLAQVVAADPKLRSAKALYGVSMINRGPEKFGFTVHELAPGPFSLASKLYLRLLLSVIHPAGQKRLKQRTDQLVPKMIVMPVEELLQRYGQQHHTIASGVAEKAEEEAFVIENEVLTEQN